MDAAGDLLFGEGTGHSFRLALKGGEKDCSRRVVVVVVVMR